MKKLVIFVTLFLVLLTAFTSLASAVRQPTVGGDDDAWGDVLNEYLNVSHNATGELKSDAILNFTSNLTLGQKITFAFGEIIDNLVDDWIRVSGHMNVTNNLTVMGNVGIGVTNPRAILTVNASRFPSFVVEAPDGSDWFTVGDESGLVRFNSQGGRTEVGGAGNLGARMNIGSLSSITKALAVSGVVAQTANIFEVNSVGSLGGDYFVINGTNGYVGIGITSPQNRLNVLGDANITGNLYSNGVLVASSSGISGIGTYGYIPMWNSTSSINNSAIYQNGSFIGIGTTNPTRTLQLFGSADSFLKFTNTDTGSLITDGVEIGIDSLENLELINRETGNIHFTTGGQDRVTILTGGNVGIGFTSPTTKLEIFQSDTTALYPLYVRKNLSSADYNALARFGQNGLTVQQFSNGEEALTTWARWDITDDRWEADSTTTVGATQVLFDNDGFIQFNTNASSSRTAGDALTWNTPLYLGADGKVGIGTNAPSTALEVSGTGALRLNGTAPQIQFNNSNNRIYWNEQGIYFAGGGSDRVFINSSTGYAGINTTTPQNTLNVLGNANITGTFNTNLLGSYGSGSAYVCVFNNGTLFSSETACP